MRALILPVTALALAGAVVLVGGRMVEAAHPSSTNPMQRRLPLPGSRQLAAEAGRPGEMRQPKIRRCRGSQASRRCQPRSRPAAAPRRRTPGLSTEAAKDTARSRLVAPAIVAPPDLAAAELQREAPREPLSQLSLALPPKPEMKNEWAGTAFFRPVAIKSAVFESMGRTIAISGVESVPLDESCDYEGVSWQCGVRARTAFRLWLRGRALVCQLPDEEQAVTSARCRLAKQDAGAWLVANGWALAAPDGPYVQAEEKARAERMGIFGGPPDTSSISAVPDAPVRAARSTPADHDRRGRRSAAGSRDRSWSSRRRRQLLDGALRRQLSRQRLVDQRARLAECRRAPRTSRSAGRAPGRSAPGRSSGRRRPTRRVRLPGSASNGPGSARSSCATLSAAFWIASPSASAGSAARLSDSAASACRSTSSGARKTFVGFTKSSK